MRPEWPSMLGWSVANFSPVQNHTPVDSVVCNEATEYEQRCSRLHGELDAELHEWRYKRGLVLEYEGNSYWGLGMLLTHAFVMHHICRRLKRFCYVRLYDSRIDQMFRFRNGMSFSPDPDELVRAKTEDAAPSVLRATLVAFTELIQTSWGTLAHATHAASAAPAAACSTGPLRWLSLCAWCVCAPPPGSPLGSVSRRFSLRPSTRR